MCANISQTNTGRIIPCIHRGLSSFRSISSNSPILSLTTTMRKVGRVAISFVQSCSAGERMPTARLQTLGLFILTLCAVHRGGHELTDSGSITYYLGLYCCVRAFSSCGERGLSSCGVWAPHCGGFSCCAAWAPDCGFSSGGARA